MGDESKDSNMPGDFNRTMGKFVDLPDTIKTRETTQTIVPFFGIGTHTYIVQTFRRREEGDYIFFQDVADGKAVQIVIPPKIAAIIASQRDQLTGKSRSRASKRVAEDRAARGIQPGFMRGKKKEAR
jgi:hypothetical protein